MGVKELFEKNGYQKNEVLSNPLKLIYSEYEVNYFDDEYDEEDGILYRYVECHNIEFDLLFNSIHFSKSTIKVEKNTDKVLEINYLTTGMVGERIDFKVLEAINKQVEELGWND